MRTCFPLRAIVYLQVAVMLDTKGPEIRTGLLKGHGIVNLKEGQSLILSTDYDVRLFVVYFSVPRGGCSHLHNTAS